MFNLINCVNSEKKIAWISLNNPNSLNALNIEMINLLSMQLKQWQQDDNVICILLDSSSEKAFCAGGDVKAVTQNLAIDENGFPIYGMDFFTQEYRLDYLIHHYNKPIIVWGSGLIIGGGLGLMLGASHRVVTETSCLAMPEASIGLYPDVGASYFFNQLPTYLGLFIGLTAYQLNAIDAIYINMADFVIKNKDKDKVIKALTECHWSQDINHNHQKINQLLLPFQMNTNNASSLLFQNTALLESLMFGSLHNIEKNFNELNTKLDWLLKAKKAFLTASPLSLMLIYEQMQKHQLSLAQCFRRELGWSLNCLNDGDFVEGVRALLIDKDHQPQWRFSSLREISKSYMEQLLSSPWRDESHPLNALDVDK